MLISEARKKTSKTWRTVEVDWAEFTAKLREPLRTGETTQEYRRMSKADKDMAKAAAGGFVGGDLGSGRRVSQNLRSRSMITLDADNAKPDSWEFGAMMVPYRMCCYTTHSHTSEAPRIRWIVPTSRDMTPDEYPAVARRVAEWLDMDTMDPTTFDTVRLFYYPTCSRDAKYGFWEQEGPLLDPDEILASYGRDDAWKDARLWPTAKTETEVQVREAKRQGEPTEKPGIVGLFCRTYDVPGAIDAFLSDVYTEGNHGRYTYAAGSTADGAVLYNDGAFLYSHHGTDPCGGQLVNAFDLVRIHLFGDLDAEGDTETEITKRASYKRMCEFAAGDPEVKKVAAQEKIEEVDARFGDLVETGAGERGTEEGGKDAWHNQLTMDKKTGEIEPTIQNAMVLLRNLPDFKGKLGYNPMSDVITVKGDLPWWEKQKHFRIDDLFQDVLAGDDNDVILSKLTQDGEHPWGENDWSNFYAYFEPLGFQTRGKTNGVLDHALKNVSQENTYHPIRSYLLSLEWDGTPRVSTMFIRWLGAEDTPLDREITRLWMMAGVDRIMRPGSQFDQILITCGPQGIGKSRMLRMLARGFFTNSIKAANMSKETAELLQGTWVVEMGELDGMKNGDQTTIKNFISATTDRYRGAYTRSAETHPRQCVLAGTSNEGSFLRDDTGERRYWIMPVKGTGDDGTMVGFKDEVDQLWAEAVVMWKQRLIDRRQPGQRMGDVDAYLFLEDKKLKHQMEARQMGYKLPEEDRDDIIGYLDTRRPANWFDMAPGDRRRFALGDWIGDASACTLEIDRISVKELRCELFGERMEDTGKKTSKSLRIVSVLDSLPEWRKTGKVRIPGYGNGVHQTWVRRGSKADWESPDGPKAVLMKERRD